MGGHEVLKPTKYRTIHDIPDELIPRTSKRDPENMMYQTRRWVNFKKKQILFQQQDGVPNYLRTPASKAMFYFACSSLAVGTVLNIYLLNHFMNKK
jgi:phosphatidate phosphatase APP1